MKERMVTGGGIADATGVAIQRKRAKGLALTSR
jgi:hypothetical protein